MGSTRESSQEGIEWWWVFWRTVITLNNRSMGGTSSIYDKYYILAYMVMVSYCYWNTSHYLLAWVCLNCSVKVLQVTYIWVKNIKFSWRKECQHIYQITPWLRSNSHTSIPLSSGSRLCSNLSLLLHHQCSPEGYIASYGRGGSTPALAAAPTPATALLPALVVTPFPAQRCGHVATGVALVGQVLVEGHHHSGLAHRGPPCQHVVLAHVRQLPAPVGSDVGLWVAAAAWWVQERERLWLLIRLYWDLLICLKPWNLGPPPVRACERERNRKKRERKKEKWERKRGERETKQKTKREITA